MHQDARIARDPAINLSFAGGGGRPDLADNRKVAL